MTTTSSFAYFDCFAGIAGDMALGALLDAGGDLEALRAGLRGLDLEPFELAVETVERGGIGATRVAVRAGQGAARTWSDVRELLRDATLPEPVRARALATFELLAQAEGRVHRVPPEQVHFHEVGALDALADIVGACAGLAALDLDQLTVGPIALGSGTIRAAHGELPVPGPAVVRLLARTDAVSHGLELPDGTRTELLTPTGAALIVSWATGFGPMPAMRISGQGYGAGGKDFAGKANVLRLVLGVPASGDGARSTQALLETNVDDLDPRLWPGVLAALMEAGAADAWLTPILMKKGRPAHTVSVLVDTSAAGAVEAAIFRLTSAIGLRSHDVAKTALDRRIETVVLPSGTSVRVKVAVDDDGTVVNVMPEHDDVSAAASATGVPAKVVAAQAIAAAADLWIR
jgi:pyridinium-3,5-bisthiocarboxylic acid mononucleotide nickel chelatase